MVASLCFLRSPGSKSQPTAATYALRLATGRPPSIGTFATWPLTPWWTAPSFPRPRSPRRPTGRPWRPWRPRRRRRCWSRWAWGRPSRGTGPTCWASSSSTSRCRAGAPPAGPAGPAGPVGMVGRRRCRSRSSWTPPSGGAPGAGSAASTPSPTPSHRCSPPWCGSSARPRHRARRSPALQTHRDAHGRTLVTLRTPPPHSPPFGGGLGRWPHTPTGGPVHARRHQGRISDAAPGQARQRAGHHQVLRDVLLDLVVG